MRRLLACLLLLAAAAAQADDGPRPFVRGSMQQILQAHRGQPFILGLWSISCSPCRDELAVLGRVMARHRKLALVLVAADAPGDGPALAKVLRGYRLQRAESWVFAESFTERLRYEIDREWYGELPRSYFFDAQGNAQALSGRLDAAVLEQWVRQHE